MKLPENIELLKSTTAPIFHVDDDELMIELVKRNYRRAKIPNPYAEFFDGDSFLDKMTTLKETGGEYPLLVLLDINMPGRDGFEVLEELRKSSTFSSVPLCCMLSSSTYEPDISRSMALGANGYAVKPDDAKEYKEFFLSIAEAANH